MMNYKFGDGWIFRAIHLTDQGNGVELKDMIRTADFINKAIPEPKEINHACSKLLELHFIEIVNGKLFATELGNKFISSIEWNFDRSQHPCEFASAIADKLDPVKSAGDEFENHFSNQEVKSAQNDYRDDFNRLQVSAKVKNADDR